MTREIDLASPFNTPYFRNFYDGYRDQSKDLFDSEQYFFDSFAEDHKSYLDIGCALGGMLSILESRLTTFQYNGVDIAAEMIDGAREIHPEANFKVVDGAQLPYDDESYDRVITLGTTVHDQEFEELLSEAWRVTKELLFFDIRIIDNLPTIRSINEGSVRDDANMSYPYVVVNGREFRKFLRCLDPTPKTIRAYGYLRAANEFTTLPPGYENICMTTFLIEKNDCDNMTPTFDLKLPIEL